MLKLRWTKCAGSDKWWTTYMGRVIKAEHKTFTFEYHDKNDKPIKFYAKTLDAIIQEIDEQIEDNMHLHT